MVQKQYNESQQQAINANEENVVVIAPAGSGKTLCMTGAIERYRKEHPRDTIVAITFTRKAAAELQERVDAPGIEVSTIHSWAYRRLYQLAGEYDFKVQLLEEDVIKDILKKLSQRARQYYLNQFLLYSYVMGNYNVDVDGATKKIFDSIRHAYIVYKERNQLYDFTDLPKYLLDKLNEYYLDITDVNALFVDEFQDVDAVQLELFNRTHTQKKFYIGDINQAIYQFRGAISEIFDELKDFTIYNLDTNYRSYQNIIDAATTLRDYAAVCIAEHEVPQLTEYVGTMQPSAIKCARGNHTGSVYVVSEIGRCVEWHEQTVSPRSDTLIVKQMLSDKKTQVLCRTNKQVKKIDSLGISRVSTIHQAKGLEYDNVVLVDFPMDCEEELNVAYVGMTRAKNKLCIIPFDILCYIICTEQIEANDKLF